MQSDEKKTLGGRTLGRPAFGELVSRKTLMTRLDIKSPTTIYAMMARNELPRPITIGRGSKRWVWSAIEEGIAQAHDEVNGHAAAVGSSELSS